MVKILGLVLAAVLCSAADVAWPDVPDPIGLGPRLATLAWLRDHGAKISTNATDQEIVLAYDRLSPQHGADPIRNRKFLAPVMQDRSDSIRILASGSGPSYCSKWLGDWATDSEWTDYPNLAVWGIRLSYVQPDGTGPAGGSIVVTTTESEQSSQSWRISTADGRDFRDDGSVNGFRHWTLPLRSPALNPIVVHAVSGTHGSRRTWSASYIIAGQPSR